MAHAIHARDAAEWMFLKISSLCQKNKVGVPLIVGFGAPSAAGKGYITEKLVELLGNTTIVSLDFYYRGVEWMKKNSVESFDDPRALDLNAAATALSILKYGHSVTAPIYDFKTGKSAGTRVLDPTPVIIVEGLFALMNPILKELDYKVFVSTDPHSSLLRRLLRDATSAGRTKQTSREVFSQFFKEVLPSTISFVNPTSEAADLIINSCYDAEHESVRANVFERQMKILGHPDHELLQSLGAQRVTRTHQQDVYFVPKDRSITGEIVRLRYEGGGVFFTYKGPFLGGMGTMVHARAKREFEIMCDEADILKDVYKEHCRITKVRTIYNWMGFEIALDEVQDLGKFTEVRSVMPGNVKTLPQAVSELELEKDGNKSFIKSYFDLYLETHKKIPRPTCR